MAYRDVAMWEILSVLRRRHRGQSKSAVAQATGHSRSTIRRYEQAARELGWSPETQEPTEELALRDGTRIAPPPPRIAGSGQPAEASANDDAMRILQQDDDSGRNALTFALGALGGLAIGVLLTRRDVIEQVPRLGAELRDRVRDAGDHARTAARSLRPARLRRLAGEQAELTELEDRVLEAFLGDETLGERGIDVGAISPGIIELSGSVGSESEAHHAVDVASGIPGVRTVVNRMEIEEEAERLDRASREASSDPSQRENRWTGRMVGMNRRRQGRETDPDRPDDSQIQETEALRRADRDQWVEEGLAWDSPQAGEAPEVQRADRTRYDEDELGNQDPHGKHAERTLDEQPQALNPEARVGEGLKTGTHLKLEQAEVPGKPHGGRPVEGADTDQERG